MDDQARRKARKKRVNGLTRRSGMRWLRTKLHRKARRAEKQEQFFVDTAREATEMLGDMKGVMMKVGQFASFVFDDLPDEAKQSLGSLRSNAPAVAPDVVAGTISAELGSKPDDLFVQWEETPIAAASIGQVHRATLPDGRAVAVKVQYPDAAIAVGDDLANAGDSSKLAKMAMKNLDVDSLTAELTARLGDEIDYRLEAGTQAAFAERFSGHPFIRVPAVVPELSTTRVLTTEWADGLAWEEFTAVADDEQRQRAAEIVFRFVYGSIFGPGLFNGDPHPGNYRFAADGSVWFLDFGLAKRWDADELAAFDRLLDAILAGDRAATMKAGVAMGYLEADQRVDAEAVYRYLAAPYEPLLTDSFTFTPGWVVKAMKGGDEGGLKGVSRKMNLPPSTVIFTRVTVGLNALLGQLGATNRWGAIVREYRQGGAAATPLGELEAAWAAKRRA